MRRNAFSDLLLNLIGAEVAEIFKSNKVGANFSFL